MIKKIIVALVIIFVSSANVHADEYKQIEIFDSIKGKVVNQVKVNPEIYNLINNYLNNIDGIYAKNDPVPDRCIAIKVPLDPPIKVENKWLNTRVNEVFIIVPKEGLPFLMVFENENKLSCFPLNGDLNLLLKNLKID